MTHTRTRNLRIAQVQLVTAFPAQETLVARLDSVLSKLARALNAKRVMPHAMPPGAPPEIPRVLMFAQNTFIQVALNRLEARITPPEHVASGIDSAVKYFADVLNGVLQDLFNSAPRADWAGVVLRVEYPMHGKPTAIDAIRPAFRKLVNIQIPDEDLSAFNLMFGVKSGDFFRHITVQGYQAAEVVAELKEGTVDIPVDQAAVTEAGVQLIFDVNNKPSQIKAGSLPELVKALEELRSYCKGAPSALGLEQLLSHE